MHIVFVFCQWLDGTSLADVMRESTWLFPAIESFHIWGSVLLVATTSVLCLRLLGWGWREQLVSGLARQLLPWAWVGFGIQVLSGFLLFSSEAVKAYHSTIFWTKMGLIVLAGVNALVFHYVPYRHIKSWDNAPVGPLAAKLSGAFSIVLWFTIIALGRYLNTNLSLMF